ncbi:MAG: NAD-dependent epimerase/dehydratase family protein [Pirellulales bacterium]|nr:NAD-dependent epimerase/dehydratase family protein [Pirellulales bacterium]
MAQALKQRGHHVKAGYRRQAIAASEGIEPVSLDVRDAQQVLQACAGVDAVIHVAGLTGIWGSWRPYYETNVVGTENVIDACRRQGVSKLVFTSSPSVTFDGDDQSNVNETAPYPRRWLCAYPRSKAIAEQAVLAANDEQLLTCALRPHLIWGPGDLQLVPELVRRAAAGKLRQIGQGKNLIDATHIDNAAAAHLAALDSLVAGAPACGKAYFISQDEPVNCWDWIREVVGYFGAHLHKSPVSARVAWRAASVFEAGYKMFRIRRQPLLTRFLVAQLSTSHYFDISAARRDLGYHPPLSMSKGLEQLAAMAAEHGSFAKS